MRDLDLYSRFGGLTQGLPLTPRPQSPLHPIPASPTSPQSALGGSNSTLSGSASSGVSSLGDSSFGGPASSANPPPSRTDTLESVPSSQAWTTDQEELDSPYQPIRYSISEPDVLGGANPAPCRSHSAPGGAKPAQALAHPRNLPQVVGVALAGAPQPAQQVEGLAYLQPHYHLYQHFYHHHLPPQPPLYHLHEPPPALPPKPTCIPAEECAPPLPTLKPTPRKISQPLIATAKDEQAKVAWEHGIGEE